MSSTPQPSTRRAKRGRLEFAIVPPVGCVLVKDGQVIAENRRDFFGRVVLINLLRALHLVGVVGLGAAALGVRPVSETTAFAGILMASGILIAALDRWVNPDYFLQLNGLTVLLKVLLLAGVAMLAGFDAVLFWAVLVGSVLMAHAPRALRHRKMFWL